MENFLFGKPLAPLGVTERQILQNGGELLLCFDGCQWKWTQDTVGVYNAGIGLSLIGNTFHLNIPGLPDQATFDSSMTVAVWNPTTQQHEEILVSQLQTAFQPINTTEGVQGDGSTTNPVMLDFNSLLTNNTPPIAQSYLAFYNTTSGQHEKILISQLFTLIPNGLEFQGIITNADTNPPFPSSPNIGDVWFIGTNNGTVGGIQVEVGDQLIYTSVGWFIMQANTTNWKNWVPNLTALNSLTQNQVNDIRFVQSENALYYWDGTQWNILTTTVPGGTNVVYLANNGNDSTGIIGREDRPFATPAAAFAACPPGGTIIVKGVHNLTAPLMINKSAIRIHFNAGASFQTTNGNMFLIQVLPGNVRFTITGEGIFGDRYNWNTNNVCGLYNLGSGSGGCINCGNTSFSGEHMIANIECYSNTQQAIVWGTLGTALYNAGMTNVKVRCTGGPAVISPVSGSTQTLSYGIYKNCMFVSTISNAFLTGPRFDGFRMEGCTLFGQGQSLYARRCSGVYVDCNFISAGGSAVFMGSDYAAGPINQAAPMFKNCRFVSNSHGIELGMINTSTNIHRLQVYDCYFSVVNFSILNNITSGQRHLIAYYTSNQMHNPTNFLTITGVQNIEPNLSNQLIY